MSASPSSNMSLMRPYSSPRCLTLSPWIFVILTVFVASQSFGRSYSTTAEGSSDLRKIGMATLIYAQGNKDQFPAATDVRNYARLLAESGGLDDGRAWQMRIDPATASTYDIAISVLSPSENGLPGRLNPRFLQIKPSYAVAVGRMHTALPSTTPIAWTRGLQSDGTWAAHSPYGTKGGLILFLGGNVSFYRNLTDDGGQLIRPDGSKTADILEALPRGARVIEYVPTPIEQTAWTAAERQLYSYQTRNTSPRPWILMLVMWGLFLPVSLYRYFKHKPGVFSILVYPTIITILMVIIIPTVSH